jgi:hypothetical protein
MDSDKVVDQLFITNLVISKISNRVNHCIIQATFSNASEPDYCRDFRLTIRKEFLQDRLTCLSFCVNNKRLNRLEDVQTLFSDDFINQLMVRILSLSNKQSSLSIDEVEAI